MVLCAPEIEFSQVAGKIGKIDASGETARVAGGGGGGLIILMARKITGLITAGSTQNVFVKGGEGGSGGKNGGDGSILLLMLP